MRKDLIDIVCCPKDKAKLVLEDAELDSHGDVLVGKLRCSQCGFPYPVEDGIPNLLPPEFHVGTAAGAKKAAGGKVVQASEADKPEQADAAEREAVAEDE